MKGATLQTTVALFIFLLLVLLMIGLYRSPTTNPLVVPAAEQPVLLEPQAIEAVSPAESAGTAEETAITVTASNAAAANADVLIYVVQPGEGLWRIAQNNNTTVDAILAVNPQLTDPDVITPGQELVIPIE